MNKICVLIIAALCFISTVMMGCAIFTPQNVPMLARVVGVATASTVDLSDLDDNTKLEVSNFLYKISKTLPTSGETFLIKWEPIINEKLNELVQDKKIKHKYSLIIKQSLLFAAQGIDYLFNTYPKCKETTDISLLAISYFIDGFNSILKPVSFSIREYNNKLIKEYEYVYNDTVKYFSKK